MVSLASAFGCVTVDAQPAKIGSGRTLMFRCVLTAAAVVLLACTTGAEAQEQTVGAPPEASNMKLVGSNDLQARSAYQPTIHHQGGRWIAYIGHHRAHDEI